MNRLQRMLVIDPVVFEKWKAIITHDAKLSALDKNMKSILYNSKISDHDKWLLYRDNLIRYKTGKQKRGILRRVDAGTQTRDIHRNDAAAQTRRTIRLSRETQMPETMLQTDVEQSDPELTDPGMKTSSPKEIYYHAGQDTSPSSAFNTPEDIVYDRDESMREMALEDTPTSTRIIAERPSREPDKYRLYELSTGEIVTVDVPTGPSTRDATRAWLERTRPVTRSWLKKSENDSQTKLNFPHRRQRSKPPSKKNSPSKKPRSVTWAAYE